MQHEVNKRFLCSIPSDISQKPDGFLSPRWLQSISKSSEEINGWNFCTEKKIKDRMWLMYIIRQLIPLKHGLKQGYNSKKSMYSMKYTFFKTVNPQFGGHPLYQMAIFTLENPLFIPDHYDTFFPPGLNCCLSFLECSICCSIQLWHIKQWSFYYKEHAVSVSGV